MISDKTIEKNKENFEGQMLIKKDNVERWKGTYRGVDFEINNWKIEMPIDEQEESWTYYIFIRLDRIPEENNPESYWLSGEKWNSHVMYYYYKHPVLPNLEWHGGITWYSKEHGFDDSEKIIKVGCDYRHIWDVGKYYDLEIVKAEVQGTIDKFLEYVPNYKYWCIGNGKLYNLDEGIIKNGTFYSKEYWGDKEWFKEIYEA